MFQGREVGVKGNWMTISAPADYIPLHFRGGYILPTQQPANSTMIRLARLTMNNYQQVYTFNVFKETHNDNDDMSERYH